MLKVLMSHWIFLMIFFLSLLIVFAKYFYVVLFKLQCIIRKDIMIEANKAPFTSPSL